MSQQASKVPLVDFAVDKVLLPSVGASVGAGGREQTHGLDDGDCASLRSHVEEVEAFLERLAVGQHRVPAVALAPVRGCSVFGNQGVEARFVGKDCLSKTCKLERGEVSISQADVNMRAALGKLLDRGGLLDGGEDVIGVAQPWRVQSEDRRH